MNTHAPGRGDDPPPRRAVPSPPRAGPARSVRSDDLLAGAREVAILHNDETYRLRLTAAGKLILTK